MATICQDSTNGTKSLCNGSYYGFYITYSDFPGSTITNIQFKLKGSNSYTLKAYAFKSDGTALGQFGASKSITLTSSYQTFEFSDSLVIESDTYFVFYNDPSGNYLCNGGNNEYAIHQNTTPTETRIKFVYKNYTTGSWTTDAAVYPNCCITVAGGSGGVLLPPPYSEIVI